MPRRGKHPRRTPDVSPPSALKGRVSCKPMAHQHHLLHEISHSQFRSCTPGVIHIAAQPFRTLPFLVCVHELGLGLAGLLPKTVAPQQCLQLGVSGTMSSAFQEMLAPGQRARTSAAAAATPATTPAWEAEKHWPPRAWAGWWPDDGAAE